LSVSESIETQKEAVTQETWNGGYPANPGPAAPADEGKIPAPLTRQVPSLLHDATPGSAS
jgi:hypothetical protein